MATANINSRQPPPPSPPPSAITTLFIIFSVYATIVWIATCSLSSTPVPLLDHAPPSLFSEGRALRLTTHLAQTIGHRQVATWGEEQAAQYLMQKGREVQQLAMQYRPDDLEVQVLRESVTGAVTMEVFGYEIANVFNNLTNVLVVMTPKDPIKAQNKAVLINGHYDSTLGTVGASDCASCVAVGMEIARTIASNTPDQIPVLSPLVFLFNGGEETLMQASYGFMTFSPLAQNLGAFINIESTGPGGPDIVFQHTGDWALEAYARVAPYPRGSSIAQDFFDAGVIPADTDFRMFSHKHQGSLSGIDTAQIFDGTAYHTARDEVGRIRSGTLQAMGENVLATVIEYSRVLNTTTNDDNTGQKPSHQPLVFYDIFARYMVVYPASIANIIHHIPLLVLLSLLVFSSFGSSMGRKKENGEKKDTLSSSLTTTTIVMPSIVYKGVGISVLSILGSLLIPALTGSFTTLLYGGIPMPWYGEKDLAMCIFVPAALVGLLLPYITLMSDDDDDYGGTIGKPLPPSAMMMMQSLCLGSGLFFAIICSLLTIFDMQSSFLFALWSGGTAIYGVLLLLLSSLSKKKNIISTNGTISSTTSIILLLLPHIIPLSVVCVSSLSLSYHIMEKLGLAGSLTGIAGKIVADCVVGVVTGFSVYLTAGTLVPVFIVGGLGIGGGTGVNGLMMQKRTTSPPRILIAVLLGMSVGASVFAANRCKENHHPYSYKHPKRILVQHIHKQDGVERAGGHHLSSSSSSSSSIWSAAALDSIPVDIALPPSFLDLPQVDFSGEDWAALYPLNYLVTGLARKAPAAEAGAVWPDLRLIDQQIMTTTKHNDITPSSSSSSSSYRRLHLELDTVKAAWAVLNITGNVMHWSLNDKVAHTERGTVHMVRYASKVYTTVWSFWLDVKVDESVIIKVYVKHLDETEELKGLVSEMPEWVSPIAVTTWQLERQF
jgi:hypothetical protein